MEIDNLKTVEEILEVGISLSLELLITYLIQFPILIIKAFGSSNCKV